jgi:hypothetical protein
MLGSTIEYLDYINFQIDALAVGGATKQMSRNWFQCNRLCAPAILYARGVDKSCGIVDACYTPAIYIHDGYVC